MPLCLVCQWDVPDPCVTADAEHRKPRGCKQIAIENGVAFQLRPAIEDDSDGCGAMRRFAIEDEISLKFDLI